MTNITVPLLGMVDSAITGHLGSTAYIGAITVGSMAFNLMYWLFSFLRMGTSGLTSQALGRGDHAEVRQMLRRSLRVAMTAALLLLVCQWPVRWLVFALMGAEGEVLRHAYTYYNICIWGAPASLGLFALTGWFVGMQNSRVPMWVAIVQNITNILCSLVLVYGFHLSMRGVALGTLVAQWVGFLFACSRVQSVARPATAGTVATQSDGTDGDAVPAVTPPSPPVEEGDRLRSYEEAVEAKPSSEARPSPPGERWKGTPSFFAINRDIFLRTLCLVSVNLAFTAYGARQGEVMLAVNGLLIQLFILFSYFVDGFAFAGEAMSGKAIGGRDARGFRLLVRHLFGWGLGIALCFTLLYATLTPQLIGLLTDQPVVLGNLSPYIPFIALVPLLGMPAFIWDGIYIGATASRQMLWAVGAATALFFGILAVGRADNLTLWVAMLAYLAMRGLMQTLMRRQVYTMARG